MRADTRIEAARKPWRVVVVDDNPDDRAEIRRLLLHGSDRRYTFAEAETGEAGIHLCLDADGPADCLLLDYNLPDMEATEVIAALTGGRGLPACPVVVLTGSAASEAGRAVLRAGAQDYIGKDWLSPQGLTRAVENAIERWEMAWDLRDREARLRASEARLRMFIEHAPAAIAMLDREMRYLVVSRRWRDDYGLNETDYVGRSHYEVFPKIPERWRLIHQQALAGQVLMADEDRLERPDGSITWLKWEVRPWPDHAGNVGGIIIFTEDITERKQAENDLRVTTERFQAALQASHVVVFNQDRDLRYTWIHNPWLRFTESEIIGKRDGDLFPRAEDVARLESIKRTVMESGVSQRHEVPILYEGVMRHYDMMVQPQRDALGTIIGVTCAGVDITERKQASAALQESEERLRLSLDAAGAGMWELVPATGEFIATDRALALHGLPLGTPMNHDRILAAVYAEDRPRVEAALRHSLASGDPFVIEVRSPQPDGSIRWLSSRAELRRGQDQPRLVGLVQDITARKRVESNLAFLAELSEAFVPAATTEQIARIAAQQIIRHFDASRVNFSDVSRSGDEITVFYSQRGTHLKEDRITHRLSEYLSETLVGDLRTGQTVAVSDVRTDPGTAAHAAAYLQWDIGSMMLAPHVSKGRWRFLIVLHKEKPYPWRNDEIELLREVATRVYLRLELARAIEGLSAAHDTFRHLVENSPFGVFAVDADFRLVQVSAGAQRLFENIRPLLGCDFTEVWSIIWPEPFASEAAGRFRRTLETGEAYRATSTVERRRDTGEVESYDWKIERVVLPDGRCGVVCHFYDLSERQRWEAALVAKEREVRTLTENSPDVLTRYDRNLCYVFVNSAIQKVTGRSRSEFLGKTDRELGMPAGLCDQWEAALRGVFKSGKPSSIEFRFDTPDGLRDYSSRLVPEFGPEGNLDFVLVVTRDVTERRQAEADLRPSEEKFRTLADNMSQLAWMADASGSVFWYNRRWYEYTGTTLEEMQDWGWKRVHHPDHVDRVVQRVQRSWDTGEEWEDTFPLRGKDGEYRWFLSRALPIRDDQGQIVRWLGTNTDITEQRQLEQALQAADRRKDEFIAMVSHEMRNPLSAILSCVAILHAKGLSDPDLEWARDVIDRQSRQLNRIIEDLLDVSRITRGSVQLRCETTDVRDAVRRAAEAVRPLLEAKQHNLALSLPDSPLRIHADPARLEQIFANLLTNAAKYTDEGGHIAVRTDREEGDVLVHVRDSGIGIPTEQLTRIFQMFAQVDQSLDRSRGGLGIGLTLVKSLTEIHGGSVSASSDGLGKGSEFTVRLPLHAPERPLPGRLA